jgi:hypothetical protein
MLESYIDGPLPTETNEFDEIELAHGAILGLIDNGRLQLRSLADGTRDHAPGSNAYRITSWVEQDDSRFGYALAISKVDFSDPANIAMEAKLFLADRLNHTLVEEPKSVNITSHSENSLGSTVIEELDTTEIMAVVGMIGKTSLSYKDNNSRLDRDVALSLMNDNIDDLAALFPGRSEIKPGQKKLDELMATSAFRGSIEERLSGTDTAFSHDGHCRELSLQHNVDGSLYAIKFSEVANIYFVTVMGNIGTTEELYDSFSDNDDEGREFPVYWDEKTLVSIVKDGTPISGQLFNTYVRDTYPEAEA